MSIPSCIRPQRQPNGLVTGPATGQMRPADDGVESTEVEETPGAAAGRLRRADLRLELALEAWSASISLDARPLLGRQAPERGALVGARAVVSLPCAEASWSRTSRTWAARTAIVRVSAATPVRERFVRSRARRTSWRAAATSSAMRRSSSPIWFRKSIWSSMSEKLRAEKTTSNEVGLVRLVDVDDPPVAAAATETSVLLVQEAELGRLEAEELGQRVEAPLVEVEVVLERREAASRRRRPRPRAAGCRVVTAAICDRSASSFSRVAETCDWSAEIFSSIERFLPMSSPAAGAATASTSASGEA